MDKIILTLDWFSKDDEIIVSSEDASIDLSIARKAISIDCDYDPYISNSYDVTEENKDALQQYYQHKIDLNKYYYSVGVYGDSLT